MCGNILRQIVETKCAEVAAARKALPIDQMAAQAHATPPPRDFRRAVVQSAGDLSLIAEIKKASPSAGLIRAEFDPVAIAKTYAVAGAAALSVLTDRVYFSGDLSFVEDVKRAVGLPVLRKDFLVDEYQVYESRAAGADAILLIAAILTVQQIETFAALSGGMGMTSLIEVHDEEELAAVQHLVGPSQRILLGINNRNLATQRIDLATASRLAQRLPPGTPFAAESGLSSRDDVDAMRDAGARAVLIGESFMRAADIATKVRELMGPQ